MDEKKRDLGSLGKLAAIATALTAIFSLVFLLFPGLKPTADTDQTLPPAEVLGPEGAASIRAVLAANEAADAREATAFVPLELEPPGVEASPQAQARYLVTLAEYYGEVLRVSQLRLAAMEGVKLGATPDAFRQAMLAYLSALREQRQVVEQAQLLATRAALEVQVKGSRAYSESFISLGDLGSSAVQSDTAVNQSWANVKAAAASAGLE